MTWPANPAARRARLIPEKAKMMSNPAPYGGLLKSGLVCRAESNYGRCPRNKSQTRIS